MLLLGSCVTEKNHNSLNRGKFFTFVYVSDITFQILLHSFGHRYWSCFKSIKFRPNN